MLALCHVTEVITSTVCKKVTRVPQRRALSRTLTGAFEARLNSKNMHMTDIEAKAMQAGFKLEEVKTSMGTQTFRQRSLGNETKNIEFKKIVFDYRNGNELLLCESGDTYLYNLWNRFH